MIEFYPEIRLVHIAAVIASGGLFALRALALFVGGRPAIATALRFLNYTADTVLLTAALMLMTITRQYPFVHGWLTVKLLLLVVYIVLGASAFRSVPAPSVRIGFWLAALAVYAFIISVALSRDPLGFFAGFATA